MIESEYTNDIKSNRNREEKMTMTKFTEQEKEIILAYRDAPEEYQLAILQLLGLHDENPLEEDASL